MSEHVSMGCSIHLHAQLRKVEFYHLACRKYRYKYLMSEPRQLRFARRSVKNFVCDTTEHKIFKCITFKVIHIPFCRRRITEIEQQQTFELVAMSFT